MLKRDYTVTKVRTAERGDFFQVKDVTFASVHWGGILIAEVDTEAEGWRIVGAREYRRELVDEGIIPSTTPIPHSKSYS